MSKCRLLVKVQLIGSVNMNRLLHTKNKKQKRRLIGMAAAMLFVLAIMIFYSSAIAIACVHFGMERFLPSLILMFSAAITLVITFMKSNGVLFGFRDYDLVMSLPVKNSTVISSRLLTVYLMNMLLSCVVMLPSMIVYGITVHAPVQVWLMMVAAVVLAPLLPMIIAMIAGAGITAVSVRSRHKNVLATVLSVALILALFGFTAGTQWDSASLTSIGTMLAGTINRAYPPAALFTNALEQTNWGSFAQFALISVGAAALFVLVLSVFYTKINSTLFSVRTKNNYQMKTLKSSTPFKALYLKEVRRLFTCSIYLMNSTIGCLLLVMFSVGLLFVNPNQMEVMMGIPDVMEWIRRLAPWLIAMFIGMSSTTAASVSLEGKSRWLMCSSPVSAKTLLNAKIAVNLTVLIPSALVSSTLLSIRLGTTVAQTALLFIIPLLFSVYIAVIGLAYNMKFPKYDWTSEITPVKNSASVLATMGTGFVTAIASFLLSVAASLLNQTFAFVLSVGILIFLLTGTAVVYKKMTGKRLYM